MVILFQNTTNLPKANKQTPNKNASKPNKKKKTLNKQKTTQTASAREGDRKA